MAETGHSSRPGRLGRATPILRVADLEVAVGYYTGVLAFRLDWQDPGIIASVSRDEATLLLCQGDQGHAGAWVWIGVDDADRLVEEYRARGAIVRLPPTDYPWGRELQLEDPDGNVLRFGADGSAEKPFGLWRDMHGRAWARRDDGSWERVDASGAG